MGWAAPVAAVGSAILGHSQSKKAESRARSAQEQQAQYTQQAMVPYNQYFGFQGQAPQAGMSPWELAIARSYQDATQGYSPETSALQQSALFEAIDRAHGAQEGAMREQLTRSGFDLEGGTAMRAQRGIQEQRALGRQQAGRDLYFANEDLMRQQAQNLASMGQSVMNLPLGGASASGQLAQQAYGRADRTGDIWSGLAGTIGAYGALRDGRQGAETPAPTTSVYQRQPMAAGTPAQFGQGYFQQQPMALTSLNQPLNFGSMTSWQNRGGVPAPQQKYNSPNPYRAGQTGLYY